MSDPPWETIQSLFFELSELEGNARADRLAEIAARDVELAGHLRRLLAADKMSDQLLGPLDEALASPLPDEARAAIDAVGSDPVGLVGQDVGGYKIIRLIGAGGMATVYLGDDPKHNRQVAIKVLKPDLAAVIGAERFLDEIRTTANLQHPNILPLFDSGQSGKLLYYVMPYVEGDTLGERLVHEGPLPVDEAIRIATDVAEALDHAHGRGVIHRDIKPGNILLQEGRALVADFGVALAVKAAGDHRLTETGTSLGTPHYMSPEQASAEKHITGRSDVYSLGAVLYEMLVGSPPHTGPSTRAILTRILTEEPRPVSEGRPTVPVNVAATVMMALEKLPADRLQSCGELARALADPAFRRGEAAAAADVGPWRTASIALGALVVLLAGWTAITALRGPSEPGVRAWPIELGADITELGYGFATLASDASLLFTGSPEGDAVLPDSSASLWLKRLDQPDGLPIAGTEGGYLADISPDGERVAFASIVDTTYKIVSIRGGVPEVIWRSLPLADGDRALAWLDDGSLLFNTYGLDLARMSATDGSVRQIPVEGNVCGISPLPGARAALTVVTEGYELVCGGVSRVSVTDLETGEQRVVVEGAISGWYLPPGRLLYADAGGNVFARTLDLRTLETGVDAQVLSGVRVYPPVDFSPLLRADFQVTRTGHLLYARGPAPGARAPAPLYWVDRSGDASPVDPNWVEIFEDPVLSPDGSALAVQVGQGIFRSDIWVYPLPDGPPRQLTRDLAGNRLPQFTADGRSVAFTSVLPVRAAADNMLRIRPADGLTPPRTFLDLERHIGEVVFSPDGRYAVIRLGILQENADLFLLDLRTMTERPLLADSLYNEQVPRISLDGRWLAYATVGEVDGSPIYVRAFPDVEAGGRTMVTPNGVLIGWSAEEIFYFDLVAYGVAAARYRADPDFRIVSVEQLYPGGRFFSGIVHPDGQRVLSAEWAEIDAAAETDLVVIENWASQPDLFTDGRR